MAGSSTVFLTTTYFDGAEMQTNHSVEALVDHPRDFNSVGTDRSRWSRFRKTQMNRDHRERSSPECLFQIRDDIFHRFDANRHADQAVADAEAVAIFERQKGATTIRSSW
jgi:hypothetical protein